MARIGLDLDNTVARYSEGLHAAAVTTGVLDSDFRAPKTYNMVEDGWFSDFSEFLPTHRSLCHQDGLADLGLLQDNLNTLVRGWQGQGHEVVVITARIMDDHDDALREKVVAGTHRWVNTYLPSADETFIVDHSPGAKLVAGADVYVDDSPGVVNGLREAGKRVIIRDHAYNQHLDGERITCLSQITL